MRIVRTPRLILSLLGLVSSLAIGSAAPLAQQGSSAAQLAPALVGTWRLLRIEYQDANGSGPDPYYGAGCSGLLIYDASGWMSVQIVGARRATVEVPEERRGAPLTPEAARARAQAFDSYYAYYGHWRYDPQQRLVVHQVSESLIPEEHDRSYAQQVGFENGRLVLTNRGSGPGGAPLRRKIWERAAIE